MLINTLVAFTGKAGVLEYFKAGVATGFYVLVPQAHIEFYSKAFDAKVKGSITMPDGSNGNEFFPF
jgi:hypothetical protein